MHTQEARRWRAVSPVGRKSTVREVRGRSRLVGYHRIQGRPTFSDVWRLMYPKKQE